MRIYLIRHGRQNSPLCNVNVPLSDAGRRQAELLGERLKKESIDAVWSSDLIRARETADIINEKIRDREIDKRYLCITLGRPRPPEGEVSCFLLKDEQKKQVSVYHRPVPGGKTAVTRYRTLETRGELSLLEVELLTGRTHQIRATMADLGCPLLGDGKYGDGRANRRYGETRQALYSYRLTFDFPTDAGILGYLRGRSFQVDQVPFRDKYFG